jgi:hypothetical protein
MYNIQECGIAFRTPALAEVEPNENYERRLKHVRFV